MKYLGITGPLGLLLMAKGTCLTHWCFPSHSGTLQNRPDLARRQERCFLFHRSRLKSPRLWEEEKAPGRLCLLSVAGAWMTQWGRERVGAGQKTETFRPGQVKLNREAHPLGTGSPSWERPGEHQWEGESMNFIALYCPPTGWECEVGSRRREHRKLL